MFRLRAAVAVACAMLLTAACGSSGPPGDAARIKVELVAADAAPVARAVNKFGFDLFREVDRKETNTVTSPLSVAVLLAMVSAGADGDTAAELARVLGLREGQDERVGALLRELADTEDVTLSVSDALYNDGPLTDDYTDFVKRSFGATVEQADLGSADTAKKIDDWVDENTGGRITGIARELGLPSAQAVLVLLNAVYFLGKWQNEFSITRDERFTTPAGPVTVPTMHHPGGSYDYAERDGFRMLRLPYGEKGRYGMEIILSEGGETAGAADWQSLSSALAPREFEDIALPKFELRWQAELNEPLQKLGLKSAFDAGTANFRPMSPDGRWLELVYHKTYIRVDEKGTEAAGVTGGVMATSAQVNPAVFRADRPFQFTISDRETGTIVFLGAVRDPR
ncbi:serpin family protein [Paractinoplanes lichenicola]|uniref:Serpin family protein n=1 Tax=Paractinoplanes lichenicola TaxID=2802976 RepID=A0ABS1VUE9_9ACTN|nr:serpin family protein [Actinoplanes lichenicola]MBL7258110.1 serpin family protein [Actinoplanes lichenicola]